MTDLYPIAGPVHPNDCNHKSHEYVATFLHDRTVYDVYYYFDQTAGDHHFCMRHGRDGEYISPGNMENVQRVVNQCASANEYSMALFLVRLHLVNNLLGGTMATFTAKHMTKVAEVLYEQSDIMPATAYARLVERFVVLFGEDNDRFKPGLFRGMCYEGDNKSAHVDRNVGFYDTPSQVDALEQAANKDLDDEAEKARNLGDG